MKDCDAACSPLARIRSSPDSASGGKIAFLREYFDPVRAAKALNTPIVGLES